MEPTDITIEILKDIRAEGRKTNEKLDVLVGRVDRVDQRQVETELRLATEIVAMAGAVREMRDAYREDRSLRQRVDDHEKRLRELEKQTG